MPTLWTYNDWQTIPQNTYENTWDWRNLHKTLSMWHLRQKISLPTCTQEWDLLTTCKSYKYKSFARSSSLELRSKPFTEIIWILILVKSLINVTSAILHVLLKQIFIPIKKFMQKYPTPLKCHWMFDPIRIHYN